MDTVKQVANESHGNIYSKTKHKIDNNTKIDNKSKLNDTTMQQSHACSNSVSRLHVRASLGLYVHAGSNKLTLKAWIIFESSAVLKREPQWRSTEELRHEIDWNSNASEDGDTKHTCSHETMFSSDQCLSSQNWRAHVWKWFNASCVSKDVSSWMRR